MTRKKKARKVGSEGPAQYSDRSLSKDDVASLARKRANRRKGLKAGSRHSDGKVEKQRQINATRDPRLGSKKPIALIVEQKPHPKSAEGKKVRRLDAAKELDMLENDAQLNVLLDRIENGEKLGAGLQSYVDEKLDRIEALMAQLGLLEEEQEDAPVEQPKGKKSRRGDDDLLAEFENLKFDQE
ncbi:GTPase-activating protein [Enterovibrio norvegicus]|uniref:Der GTPase-activating protein YihI n=1 Tax=Enterovibrio norvegicus DSM 15893 TaxID=1121869 RepID=A0A1I5RY07_9GAMM|nr:Der GTPase-activating protein YihI [Enterovibrio norvegicus]MCC4797465.1 GTPase-activating protein [Enterovibrio norvegicus]OEE43738.1 GTPase-activating protein [Enterovibrio norvegicus]PMH64662.1 GTPase-activating protein [Enterovibrio norvegicus]PMI32822.1 GTPase-activating protein [Enterovibrio norvegicus]PMI41675.1 GTPase-activating protein [Enterovibrio norvegicus]